ncbi:hypothetical protein EV2_031711 [Malus domestica]
MPVASYLSLPLDTMVIPSAKLLPLLLLFLLFIPSASPLAFNYDSFTIGNSGIFLEGAAYIDEQVIKLTRSARQNKNVGRATYYQPFLLWEPLQEKSLILPHTSHS